MTDREAMQKAFEIIGVLKPDNFVHRELQGEAWDALRQALAQSEPQVCCGDYEKCIQSCTPRGRWLAEKESRKEWVSLTDDEIQECQKPGLSDDVYKAIEAKLRERNT